jgi:phospholipid/cholesterol/gamma-HCH transport system substrate-binding protein
MAAVRGEQWAEAGVGALVLAAAASFLIYALGHAGNAGSGRGYPLTARFGEVGALGTGADVRLAGVKIGSVAKIELDPKTFLAKTTLTIDDKVKLPSDSTVKITSDGLLGGQHIAITPGGAPEDMKPGAEFQNTQGAVDLFGLIGQAIRPQAPAAAAPAAGAPADPYPAP